MKMKDNKYKKLIEKTLVAPMLAVTMTAASILPAVAAGKTVNIKKEIGRAHV